MTRRLSGSVAVLWLACASPGAAPRATGGAGGDSGEGSGGSRVTGGTGGAVPRGTGGTLGTGGAPPPVDAGAEATGGTGPMPDAAVSQPPAPGACAKLFGAGPASEWVHYDESGKLVYKDLNPQHDRIMDFSQAGYHGGGVALPRVPVVEMVKPSGADDTAAIQAAIDAASRRPLMNGVRGAVLLAAGRYRTTLPLTLSASGVVLRGSGPGLDGTVIDLTDKSHLFLKIAGGGSRQAVGPKATITDAYVPSGARTFIVDSAAGFKIGDPVLIGRPVTAKWRTLMTEDKLPLWLAPGFVHYWERTIVALDGTKVTLDIPVSDSFDAAYVSPPGAFMQKYTFDGRISEVGVESLRLIAPIRSAAQATDPTPHGGSQILEMTNTEDAWVRDFAAHNTVEGIHIEAGSRRITVEDTRITHDPTDYMTSSAPFDFNINAAQVLIHRAASKGAYKIMFFTTHYAMGPNVLLNFDADGPTSHIQPHQKWATGLLVDSAVADSAGTAFNSGIAFMNRGTGGSDHGWAIGWGVAWNCVAPSILMQKPPGSMVWAIGCKGMKSPDTGAPGLPGSLFPSGIFESLGTPVAPRSLYLAQLCERLGPQALANLGYQ